MKVVCDSCQAKYQVPDERVAGKKLKIRCKRCGATVLIRGDLLDLNLPEGEAGAAAAFSAAGSQAGRDRDREIDDVNSVSGTDRASAPHDPISLGDLERSSQPDPIQSGEYEWHVSLDGDTQGPYSTAALRDWLNTTPGGWDAHVWREGFPDWLDARACAELGPAPAAPPMASLQDDEVPTQTFSANSFEGAQFMADLAAPRAAQNLSARGRMTSEMIEAAPRASAFAGQREQAASYAGGGFSSTLSAAGSSRPVTASSSAAGGATYTPGPNPGFASGEASGLIDIRALASLARQSTTQIAKNADATGGGGARQAAGAKGAAAARPNSGLSFGNDEEARVAMANKPSGFGRLDSLAPVSNTIGSNAALPLAILGGCALVAAAVLAAVLFNKSKPPSEMVAAPVPVEQQQSASAATAMPANDVPDVKGEQAKAMEMEPGEGAPAAEESQGVQQEGQEEDAPVVAPASIEEAEAENDELAKGKKRAAQGSSDSEKEPPPDDKNKPKKDEKPAQQDSSDVMLAERAKPVKQQTPQLTVTPLSGSDETKPADSAKVVGSDSDPMLAAKPAPAASASRSIDDLLDDATGEKSASTAAPAATSATTTNASATPPAPEAEDLPETPSRDETLAAMRGVESAVRACSENETITGTAEVAINVAGATGRVTSATVTGITGTVGSCIARAVRNARFPRFTKQTFSIKYPYRF